MNIVAFILTATEYQYEQWLRLVNDGKTILGRDLIEFPRARSVEQVTCIDPVPLVYTWGNYYINDKANKLYKELEEAGVKIVPSPSDERSVGKVSVSAA